MSHYDHSLHFCGDLKACLDHSMSCALLFSPQDIGSRMLRCLHPQLTNCKCVASAARIVRELALLFRGMQDEADALVAGRSPSAAHPGVPFGGLYSAVDFLLPSEPGACWNSRHGADADSRFFQLCICARTCPSSKLRASLSTMFVANMKRCPARLAPFGVNLLQVKSTMPSRRCSRARDVLHASTGEQTQGCALFGSEGALICSFALQVGSPTQLRRSASSSMRCASRGRNSW